MNYLTVFGKTFTFATSLTLNVALWNNYFIMCAMSRFTTNSSHIFPYLIDFMPQRYDFLINAPNLGALFFYH